MAQVTEASPLTINTTHGQQPSIEVNGIADRSNIAGLAGMINRLADESKHCVSLDLAGVEHVDTAAIEGIAGVAGTLKQRGQRLRMTSASPSVQNLIEKHFLSGLFCFEQDCCGSVPNACLAPSHAWEIDVFSLPCTMSYCHEARARVGQVADAVGFDQCLRQDVLLAVGEAVANAVTHGSVGNGEDRFTVSCAATTDKLCISISDQGLGFSLEELPSFEAALLAEHGRGIHCMRAVMDEVSFHFDAGTTVRMVKRSN